MLAEYAVMHAPKEALEKLVHGRLSKRKHLNTFMGSNFGLEMIDSGMVAKYGLHSINAFDLVQIRFCGSLPTLRIYRIKIHYET